MPYIPQIRRDAAATAPVNAGELNYQLILMVTNYISRVGLKYSTLNDIMGALEGCKLEFYRRVVAPYEETKRTQNGDVF